MTEFRPAPTCFLNVDLDISSRDDLSPLVAAFGSRMSVLFVGRVGRHCEAHLEIAGSRLPHQTADGLIRRFVKLIRDLPRPARQLWNASSSRVFNIGIEVSAQSDIYEFLIKPETLSAVTGLNAAIAFTVYPPCGHSH